MERLEGEEVRFGEEKVARLKEEKMACLKEKVSRLEEVMKRLEEDGVAHLDLHQESRETSRIRTHEQHIVERSIA